MSKDILISVLLPTRTRYEPLQRAVSTLFDLAADPESIELLLRTDDDTPTALSKIAIPDVWRKTCQEWRGSRLGYGRMHDYYNGLAERAQGKLLFVWNDDTEMLTQGWDRLLLQSIGETPLVHFIHRDINQETDDTFPVVDRRIFEALGHLSLHCYVDTWLSRVSLAAGLRHMRRDVVFHHHRFNDQVQLDNSRALASGHGHDRWQTMEAERAADVATLKAKFGPK